MFLSSRKYHDTGCSSRIRILTFYPSRILDPGVKKAPNSGSRGQKGPRFWIQGSKRPRIRIRNTGYYSPVPGHWLGRRHTEDDVSAEEQQLFLPCPFFQDIDLMEGIWQAMSPLWFGGGYLTGNVSTRRRIALNSLFQDTDWVDDIQKTRSLLKNNISYSLFLLSRTLIWWRVFYGYRLPCSRIRTDWHMQADVSAEEQQLLLACPFFQDIDLVEGILQAMSPLEEE
jgi:hypothetical protein